MDLYWHWLIVVSLVFVIAEKASPWHHPHQTFRRGWLRDVLFLALNGHVLQLLLGTWLYFVFVETIELLRWCGIEAEVGVGESWPLWVHCLVFTVASDFVQWCTHIALHKVPVLWEFHKVHHSIDRLDWIANFHFHWVEILVYKATQALPLAFLGVPYDAVLWIYVFGTFWGHFNHANLPWQIGPARFLFNSPRMHIWHHDASDEGGAAKNYGIVLSAWDWIFGTAFWPPDRVPQRLGYPGDEEMPQHFGGQMTWPLARLLR